MAARRSTPALRPARLLSPDDGTAVAAFSTRARPGCPVSTPIAWDELSPRLRPERFRLATVRRRLRALRDDPWRDFWRTRQRLGARALAAVGAAP